MRPPTMLAAAVLSGLVLGTSLGFELTAANAADPSPSAASASPSGSESTTPSASTTSSSPPTVTGLPVTVAQDSGSPSPSSTSTPSSTPTPSPLWVVAVTAPTVHVLNPIAVSGTVQAAAKDQTRPAFGVLERRTGHVWNAVHRVTLTWTGDTATFATTYTHTQKPGTYALRLTVTTATAVVARKAFSVKVAATIDIVVSGPLTRADVPLTYRAGCPVSPSHLRRVEMNFWSFHKGTVSRGSLIVRDSTVSDVKRIFTRMFQVRFPIHKMFPVDRYGGKDVRAMAADDTSAFNCRSVTGNPYRVSQHSYGNAIDINTYENPYVTSGHVYPTHHYLRRSPYRTGMILKRSATARAFAHMGWLWGARWSHPDYQHFSSNGG